MAKRRNFEIITYDLDKEKMLNKLKSLPYIKYYAFIIHDKDTYEEGEKKGELKAPHMHVMIACNNSYEVKRIAQDFEIDENKIEFIKSSYAHAVRYLPHEIAPEKFLYSANDIIANFDYLVMKKKDLSKDKIKKMKDELLRDILAGTIKQYEIDERFDKYDIDKINLIKWGADIERAFNVRFNMMQKETNRNLEVIYIQGESGVGKTTLGKILAEKKGYQICVTSGNERDMLSSYQGQECLLIDDPGPNSFPNWNEVLKLLDNHTASNFKSRYCDKSLVDVKLLIITSTLSIDELFNYFNFERKQIYRRIQTLIRLDHEIAEVYEYTMDSNTYVRRHQFKSPVKEYIDKHTKDQIKSNSIKWLQEQF